MSRACRVRVTGPLAMYADGFWSDLAAQGYVAESADRNVRTLAHLSRWPQSFSGPEDRLLIVSVPGFGCGVCLVSAGRRVVPPGVPGLAPAPTAPGLASFRVAGVIGAGQAGAGRAHSRCQQVRNASFHGQLGLIFRTRWRAWRARRAGMCQMR